MAALIYIYVSHRESGRIAPPPNARGYDPRGLSPPSGSSELPGVSAPKTNHHRHDDATLAFRYGSAVPERDFTSEMSELLIEPFTVTS